MRTTQPSRPSSVLKETGCRSSPVFGRETWTALLKSMRTGFGASDTFRGSSGGLARPAAYGPKACADRQAPTTAAAVKNCQPPLKLLRVFIAHTSALRLVSGMSLRGETRLLVTVECVSRANLHEEKP